MQTVLLRNLTVLAYGNGFTLWHYKARKTDPVTRAEFWRDAAGLLNDRDHIHVSGPRAGLYYVRHKSGVLASVEQMLSVPEK